MAQPFNAGTERSRNPRRTSLRSQRSQHARLPAFSMPPPATFSTRDLIKQRSAQPPGYSSNDLLRLHHHVIARACCEQRPCCDHSFMRSREPAAAK
ncbi:UNVERIFIED_CONTAM: hypothetical protein Slati_4524000 [Sesamum latifolium]|uniref:Uncharacterized protein n=1 Tax=Sesamum latifolium TaxID=2727402 RepID=A0AAW2SGR8_9LAMI